MCAKNHLLIFSSFLDISENVEWPRFFWTTRYIYMHCVSACCLCYKCTMFLFEDITAPGITCSSEHVATNSTATTASSTLYGGHVNVSVPLMSTGRPVYPYSSTGHGDTGGHMNQSVPLMSTGRPVYSYSSTGHGDTGGHMNQSVPLMSTGCPLMSAGIASSHSAVSWSPAAGLYIHSASKKPCKVIFVRTSSNFRFFRLTW